MSNYWYNRITKENNKATDKTIEQLNKQMAEMYKRSFNNISNDISKLYDKIQAESLTGEVAMNDFYKYNRYYELQAQINQQLKAVGEKEIKLDNEKFNQLYTKVQEITDNGIPTEYINPIYNTFNLDASQVVGNVWSVDGKNFSSRIWDNKTLLQDKLINGIKNCIVRGLPKDKLVSQIMKDMNVGFNQSDRIVRTESAYIMNTACTNSYKKAGIQKVKTIVAKDERLCDICGKHNGEIHDISIATVGVAYLFHPNCRCTIIPIVE